MVTGLPTDGTTGGLISAGNGFCAGCVSTGNGGCANDAANPSGPNATHGLGMQACMLGSVNNGALDSSTSVGGGLGAGAQVWNFSSGSGAITQPCQHGAGCTPTCLAPAGAHAP